LRGQRVEPHRQRVKLRLPVTAIAVDPQRRLKDWAGFKTAPADAAGALLRHETGTNQDLDVARHRLQRNVEWRRQLADQQIFAIKLVEYLAPHRIGQRAEHQVEGRIFAIHVE
jgi:protein subunit release factor B